MELGYEFTNKEDTLKRQLDEAGICFLHAPLFHPAMKAVVPIRKQLGMKTFFNMLGPLVNPLQPEYQLFGTFSMELSRLYQYVMQETGRSFSIVYALDGSVIRSKNVHPLGPNSQWHRPTPVFYSGAWWGEGGSRSCLSQSQS